MIYSLINCESSFFQGVFDINYELTEFRVLIAPLEVRSPNTSRFPWAAGELPSCYALSDLT